MFLNKNVIRAIYNLRYNKNNNYSTRKIVDIIKERYNIKYNKYVIRQYIVKNFPKKAITSPYSKYQISFLKRIYSNFYDKQKGIEYFNKKFNQSLTYSALITLMSKYKIKALRKYEERIVSKQDIENIIKKYQEGITASEIAKLYNYKTPKSIYDILEENKIKRRDYKELAQYLVPYSDLDFEKIDSKIKAYFLGLLLTDGYNCRKAIGIQLADKDCIEFLSVNFKVPILTIKKKNPNCKTMYRITIYGEKRIKDLESLGITKRKSLTLEGPPLEKISEEVLSYVIRGIIDGDGWIRKDGKEFFICSASKKFIDWCENVLEKFGITEMNKRFLKNDFNGIYCLRTAKQKNLHILKNKIYNIPYGMNRKYALLHNEKDVQRL